MLRFGKLRDEAQDDLWMGGGDVFVVVVNVVRVDEVVGVAVVTLRTVRDIGVVRV